MSPMPGNCTPCHTLKPRIHGTESTMMSTALIATAERRETPHWSMQNATMFSNTPMTVESAAKLIKMKNSVPHSWPPHIWSNTLGSVTNTRLGPESGETP